MGRRTTSNDFSSTGIEADVISESTSAAGVTVDGVKLKDSVPYCDTVAEKTTDAGVTVDGIKLKDSVVYTDTVTEKTGATGVTIDGVKLKDSVPYCDTVAEKTGAAGVTVDGVKLKDGGVTTTAANITTSGVGAKNGASVAVVENGDGVLHKTTLTCTATALTFGDEAGQGQYGGIKVYDFPEGLICTLGAVVDGSMTLSSPAIDTWDGDVGLGIEVVTDHQDATNKIGAVLQSTAATQATSKVANVDAVTVATELTESGSRWLDGTATAKDLFLNLLVDDNVAHDNTITGAFTGTIELIWMNLGDK